MYTQYALSELSENMLMLSLYGGGWGAIIKDMKSLLGPSFWTKMYMCPPPPPPPQFYKQHVIWQVHACVIRAA